MGRGKIEYYTDSQFVNVTLVPRPTGPTFRWSQLCRHLTIAFDWPGLITHVLRPRQPSRSNPVFRSPSLRLLRSDSSPANPSSPPRRPRPFLSPPPPGPSLCPFLYARCTDLITSITSFSNSIDQPDLDALGTIFRSGHSNVSVMCQDRNTQVLRTDHLIPSSHGTISIRALSISLRLVGPECPHYRCLQGSVSQFSFPYFPTCAVLFPLSPVQLELYANLDLGIGAACAIALAEAGATICLVLREPKDHMPPNLTTIDAIHNLGATAHFVHCDLNDLDSVKGVFQKALDVMGGRIDVLVNCAGIQRRSPSLAFSETDWDDVRSRRLCSTSVLVFLNIVFLMPVLTFFICVLNFLLLCFTGFRRQSQVRLAPFTSCWPPHGPKASWKDH